MRKALKPLETDRLVVIYPRRGSFATDIHIAHLALISDLRLQLEPLPARRAAERATEADRALCQRVLLDGLPALAGQDFCVLVQWDTGLHRLVYPEWPGDALRRTRRLVRMVFDAEIQPAALCR